jgi:hypothetical protein
LQYSAGATTRGSAAFGAAPGTVFPAAVEFPAGLDAIDPAAGFVGDEALFQKGDVFGRPPGGEAFGSLDEDAFGERREGSLRFSPADGVEV